MPKKSAPLAAVVLPKLPPGRHFDGGGLYLEVTEKGSRWWRLKYRLAGKEKLLSVGVFPAVSLAEARAAAERCRELVRQGIDPSTHRKETKAEAAKAARGTVAAVADEWIDYKRKSWAPASAKKAEFVVKTYIVPALGREPIDKLGSPAAVALLRRLAARVPDIARKARQYLNGIVSHAIAEGLREDGKVLMLDDALPRAAGGHIAAATLPDELAAVLAAIRKYSSPPSRAALLMTAYTAQRPGNIVTMRWDQIHPTKDGAEWRIPGELMKMRAPHVVPLSRQARALLDEMRAYTAGREYVFPPLARQQTPHLHRDALSAALRRMGFRGEHATHGFRAAWRTIGREWLDLPEDVLETQLAHKKRGAVAAAYDRARHIAAREKAVQAWADYLDTLGDERKVSTLRRVSGEAA